ncbi:hypothetical protein ILUMI_20986 [Ignelater luminosus]|uniref:GTP-binding protein 10 n=1 Tax=Ignelater luminosus TaxID=2038154 RepID=A0A8K0CDC1_IGNLU|nr:hypothetical protein ILUMI_20986 [Ignelater luminosus]
MVYITKFLYFPKPRKPLRKYLKSGFLDSVRVYVKGGSGGNGLPKFGGVGGQGGDVIAVAKESITLEDVVKSNTAKRYLGGSGMHSTHNFILGPPGQARSVKLDLKLIADVGLVGFPNAGKSTLLKAISQAKPKIASYPFTTIKPNIGMISYHDLRQISVADLPGLIEGAHANRGMGHEFLRHVERTKLLLIVVDINGFQLSPKYEARSCIDTVVLLNKELELYNPELLKKPTLIVVNKMDSVLAFKKYKQIREQILNISEVFYDYPEEVRPEKALEFDEILAISAKEGGEDIQLVKDKIRDILDVHAEIAREKELEQNADMMHNLRESLKEKGPRLV